MTPATAPHLDGWTRVPDADVAAVHAAAFCTYRHQTSDCVLACFWMPVSERSVQECDWKWRVWCGPWKSNWISNAGELLLRVTNETLALLARMDEAR